MRTRGMTKAVATMATAMVAALSAACGSAADESHDALQAGDTVAAELPTVTCDATYDLKDIPGSKQEVTEFNLVVRRGATALLWLPTTWETYKATFVDSNKVARDVTSKLGDLHHGVVLNDKAQDQVFRVKLARIGERKTASKGVFCAPWADAASGKPTGLNDNTNCIVGQRCKLSTPAGMKQSICRSVTFSVNVGVGPDPGTCFEQ